MENKNDLNIASFVANRKPALEVAAFANNANKIATSKGKIAINMKKLKQIVAVTLVLTGGAIGYSKMNDVIEKSSAPLVGDVVSQKLAVNGQVARVMHPNRGETINSMKERTGALDINIDYVTNDDLVLMGEEEATAIFDMHGKDCPIKLIEYKKDDISIKKLQAATENSIYEILKNNKDKIELDGNKIKFLTEGDTVVLQIVDFDAIDKMIDYNLNSTIEETNTNEYMR